MRLSITLLIPHPFVLVRLFLFELCFIVSHSFIRSHNLETSPTVVCTMMVPSLPCMKEVSCRS